MHFSIIFYDPEGTNYMNQAGWSENECRFGISVVENLGVDLGPIEIGAFLTNLVFVVTVFWVFSGPEKIKTRKKFYDRFQ